MNPGAATFLSAESSARPAGKMPAAHSRGSWKGSTVRQPHIGTMNPVGQPFQAAGSAGFPARRTYWGLDSPQNRPAGMPALQSRGSWKGIPNLQPPSEVGHPFPPASPHPIGGVMEPATSRRSRRNVVTRSWLKDDATGAIKMGTSPPMISSVVPSASAESL